MMGSVRRRQAMYRHARRPRRSVAYVMGQVLAAMALGLAALVLLVVAVGLIWSVLRALMGG